MDEALLFGPYGEIRPFVVDDKPRGQHQTEATYGAPEKQTYSASAHTTGLLPVARVWRDRPTTSGIDPKVFGPKLPLADARMDALTARSTGYGFFEDLFDTELAKRIDHAGGWFEHLEITPLPSGLSQVRVVCADVGATKALEAAILLARELVRRCDALAAEEKTWPDAASTLMALEAESTSKDHGGWLDELVDMSRDATGWLSGRPERIRDFVEVRVSLPSSQSRLDGILRLYPQPASTKGASSSEHVVHINADLLLPEVEAHDARLEPEGSGIVAWFKKLGEIEIGDRAVDDAFLVFANEEAAPLLIRAREPLVALADAGAMIRFSSDRLVVNAHDVAPDLVALSRAIESIGLVWRETSEHRVGLLAGDA